MLVAVGSGRRAVAANGGVASSGRHPSGAASPRAVRGARSACGSPEDGGCPSVPRYMSRHSSINVYQMLCMLALP